MSKRILVIGGSGFIGSHTADQLSDAGYRVTILDKEKSRWLREDQEMIEGDYLDRKLINDSLKDMDYIYHFGAVADIGESKKEPLKTIEHNVLGITYLLESIRESSVKRLMYASTAYVYSNQGSFYRVSKQSAESIIEEYSKEYGINYTFLRYGSLYGKRSQSWNGIKKFLTQIMQYGLIDYSGNGKEIREYINVEDAAKISVNLIQDKYINQALMVTGQQVIRVNDLFEMIFEILGKDFSVNYSQSFREDHYGNTPYRYTPKNAKKIVPSEFVDLGQGLLDVIEEINTENCLDEN
tara:strand:+ start:1181 stop:2068 length:888 start_codon:yes stop_codon:yes gene_type:complete